MPLSRTFLFPTAYLLPFTNQNSIFESHLLLTSITANLKFCNFVTSFMPLQNNPMLSPCRGRTILKNNVRKRGYAWFQHFLPFPQCFQKPTLSVSLKLRIVW